MHRAHTHASTVSYGKLDENKSFSIDPHIADSAIWMLRQAGLDPSKLVAWEPCAGRGDLLRGLERYAMRLAGTDLHDHPGRDPRIVPNLDVFSLHGQVDTAYGLVITNPVFSHPACERIIAHLLHHAPGQYLAFFIKAGWLSGTNPARRSIVEGGRLQLIVDLGRRVYLVEPNANGEHKGRPGEDHQWILFRPAAHPVRPPIHLWMPPEKLAVRLTARARAKPRSKTLSAVSAASAPSAPATNDNGGKL